MGDENTLTAISVIIMMVLSLFGVMLRDRRAWCAGREPLPQALVHAGAERYFLCSWSIAARPFGVLEIKDDASAWAAVLVPVLTLVGFLSAHYMFNRAKAEREEKGSTELTKFR